MENKILFDVTDKIATIILNRPDSLNALDNDMIWDFIDFIDKCKVNDEVRAILIKGSGNAFCAGDDLVDMGTERHPNPSDKMLELKQGYPSLVEQIRSIQKPVICQVHKYALGAGFEIALASDIVIAAEGTKFGLPFVLRGMASGTYFLQKYIGYHRACELLFLGEFISEEKAEEWGIVNRVVNEEELDSEVEKWTKRLSTGATKAIGLMKSSLNHSENLTMEAALHEQVLSTTLSFKTKDYQEGINSFKEKREPNFQGE